eukprot:TRINITY_DN9928_c0_g1_i1.p1 TRINITY_DN9928_c0_g1~~TRINITY_DN9928_c0_g1_i1.p1  ORF type:complete len:157 (-),score=28.04 TRINITY_DN9928_c0_g1_i1:56-526(-)
MNQTKILKDLTTFIFGQYKPHVSQLFYRTKLSYGFVNLKPVVPGHVLVIPKRKTLRFKDLEPQEVTDLFLAVQHISTKIEKHFKASALTIAIQDGKEAGMTVEHVHVHVIPRKPGDFEGDEIYRAIEKERKPRSDEEMEKEAKELSALFPDNQSEN